MKSHFSPSPSSRAKQITSTPMKYVDHVVGTQKKKTKRNLALAFSQDEHDQKSRPPLNRWPPLKGKRSLFAGAEIKWSEGLSSDVFHVLAWCHYQLQCAGWKKNVKNLYSKKINLATKKKTMASVTERNLAAKKEKVVSINIVWMRRRKKYPQYTVKGVGKLGVHVVSYFLAHE